MYTVIVSIESALLATVLKATCLPGGTVRVTVIDVDRAVITYDPVPADIAARIVHAARHVAPQARITNTWV
jgi:hypothetical protein